MATAKLILDTNIIVDFLDQRDFDFEATRLLMIAGKVGEFSLWVSTSQMTDLVYILSEGGKTSLLPGVLERLQKLRSFINVYAAGPVEVDAMLSTTWSDPEDALLYEVAKALTADAIITRNEKDFETDGIWVCNSSEFFERLKNEKGLTYTKVPI